MIKATLKHECGMYQDMREFIDVVEKLGALRRIPDADPQFEIGGVTEVAAGLPECPALLFEQIKGFAPGFRIFTNATTTPQRAALALGIDPKLRPIRPMEFGLFAIFNRSRLIRKGIPFAA